MNCASVRKKRQQSIKFHYPGKKHLFSSWMIFARRSDGAAVQHFILQEPRKKSPCDGRQSTYQPAFFEVSFRKRRDALCTSLHFKNGSRNKMDDTNGTSTGTGKLQNNLDVKHGPLTFSLDR